MLQQPGWRGPSMLLTVERMLPLASLALVGCATAPPPVLSAADWRVEPPARPPARRAAKGKRGSCCAATTLRGGCSSRRRCRSPTCMGPSGSPGEATNWWPSTRTWRAREVGCSAAAAIREPRGDGRAIRPSLAGGAAGRYTQSLRAYQRDDSCDNVWRLHEHREKSSSFEYRGPWLKAQGSYARYDFEGDRPVRRHRKMGLIFWGRAGRQLDLERRSRHDVPVGRLHGAVRVRRAGAFDCRVGRHPRDQSRTNRFWAYDGRGAVQRATVQVVPGGRQPPYDRSCEFQYDEGGREILASCGPSSRTETKYFGSCAKVIQAEPAPNVFEIMNARPCLNTQGRLGQRCF